MDFTDRLIEDFKAGVRTANAPRPVLHKAFESKPLHVAPAPRSPMAEARPIRPEISRAVATRAEDILQAAAGRALSKMPQTRRIQLEVFQQAIVRHCTLIVAAAKVNPKKDEEKRLKARAALAEELRTGRRRLREVRRGIGCAEEQADKAIAVREQELRSALAKRMSDARAAAMTELRALYPGHTAQVQALLDGYADVPAPTITPHKEGQGLPAESGIYFLWLDGIVDYVGRATRLCDRLRLGMHHVLTPAHRIGYLLLERRELTWAECYYIGVTRAPQNFGRHATHRTDIRGPVKST